MSTIFAPWSKAFFESIELPGIKAINAYGTLGHVYVELEPAEDFDGDVESLRKQYYEACMHQAPVCNELTVVMTSSNTEGGGN